MVGLKHNIHDAVMALVRGWRANDRLARLATLQGDPELVGFEDNAAHGAIHFFCDNGRGIFLSHVFESSDILASPSFAHRNSFIERETNRESMEGS
jgi:hypothetical protein